MKNTTALTHAALLLALPRSAARRVGSGDELFNAQMKLASHHQITAATLPVPSDSCGGGWPSDLTDLLSEARSDGRSDVDFLGLSDTSAFGENHSLSEAVDGIHDSLTPLNADDASLAAFLLYSEEKANAARTTAEEPLPLPRSLATAMTRCEAPRPFVTTHAKKEPVPCDSKERGNNEAALRGAKRAKRADLEENKAGEENKTFAASEPVAVATAPLVPETTGVATAPPHVAAKPARKKTAARDSARAEKAEKSLSIDACLIDAVELALVVQATAVPIMLKKESSSASDAEWVPARRVKIGTADKTAAKDASLRSVLSHLEAVDRNVKDVSLLEAVASETHEELLKLLIAQSGTVDNVVRQGLADYFGTSSKRDDTQALTNGAKALRGKLKWKRVVAPLFKAVCDKANVAGTPRSESQLWNTAVARIIKKSSEDLTNVDQRIVNVMDALGIRPKQGNLRRGASSENKRKREATDDGANDAAAGVVKKVKTEEA